MKHIVLIVITVLLTSIYSVQAQNLLPTEQQVLVEVLVSDNTGKALPGETVIFSGRRVKKTYTVVTGDQGTVSLLLPKKDVYDVSYKDLFAEKDYALLEVPEEAGLFTYNVEIIYEPSRVFVLENVYFEFGKSILKPESFASLDELVALLKAEPAMEIEISGHTDNVGTHESNMKLSQDRAESVRQYLIKKGIMASRVKAVGYGATVPIASNDTDEGRQMNRRTEVKIVKR
jgi:OmpA-OmpF porin, OOP family